MSAQFGIHNIDGQTVDAELFERFSRLLREQGPDGESGWKSSATAIGYLPFHTTKESHLGSQPEISRRGFIVTLDGRLDNREPLLSELDLEQQPPSDAAIVAAALDRWQSDCFRRLVGDWAVCVWDSMRRELLLAVDYVSVRNLFYLASSRSVWWASDIAPLVALARQSLHLDKEFVAGYLTIEPGSEVTPFEEIRQVPAASFVRFRHGKSTVERYWNFEPSSRTSYKRDSEYEQHFLHLFRQSVKRRLRSDRPMLAELSGGLDSSSIVCVADELLAGGESGGFPLDTISYYDKGEPCGDDWLYFPQIEQQRGRTGFHIDASRLLEDTMNLDADFSALPGNLGAGQTLAMDRAKVIREGGYRAVLSGLGGDEFLGGIPNPFPLIADLLLGMRIASLPAALEKWSLVKRLPLIQLLFHAGLELVPARLRQHLFEEDKVDSWLEPAFARVFQLRLRLLKVDEPLPYWLPSRRAFAAGLVIMRNKLAKRRPSGLAMEEPRFPYLDQDLIEFLLSIPVTQLLRPGERRSLMRRALRGIVPDSILARRTKQLGSRTPMLFMDRHRKTLEALFSASHGARFGFINDAAILKVIRESGNGEPVHIGRLIRVMALEIWLSNLVSRGLIQDRGDSWGMPSHSNSWQFAANDSQASEARSLRNS